MLVVSCRHRAASLVRASLHAAQATGAASSYCDDPRSRRPPLEYTDAVSACGPLQLQPIGTIRSPYKERFGTPRQPTIDTQVSGGTMQAGEIRLHADIPGVSLQGLQEFQYCWVISWLHLNQVA